jgi:hypothetical protein
MNRDFREIAHSGGTVTITVADDAEGHRSYQVGIRSARPNPMAMVGVYALPQGLIVEAMRLGGIGDVIPPPSIPGCFPVYIMSDSEGHFGHNCPRCSGYWRSGPRANVCPYCGLHLPAHEFTSLAQRKYVHQYCETMEKALTSEDPGVYEIDMDAVADAAGKEGAKPAFYVSEQSQQSKFICVACEEFNDIIGRYGYCSRCGTRNDIEDFVSAIARIRAKLNNNDAPDVCLREAVSTFDSFVAQYARQLASMVPMTKGRRNRLREQSFHGFEESRKLFSEWFDIDISAGLRQPELALVKTKFYRRHVFEHSGGQVTQRYLDDSGDTTVKLNELLRETREDVHTLLGILNRLARNLHDGFHQLFPPNAVQIKQFEDKKARMTAHNKSR